jgi:hypothetical protein
MLESLAPTNKTAHNWPHISGHTKARVQKACEKKDINIPSAANNAFLSFYALHAPPCWDLRAALLGLQSIMPWQWCALWQMITATHLIRLIQTNRTSVHDRHGSYPEQSMAPRRPGQSSQSVLVGGIRTLHVRELRAAAWTQSWAGGTGVSSSTRGAANVVVAISISRGDCRVSFVSYIWHHWNLVRYVRIWVLQGKHASLCDKISCCALVRQCMACWPYITPARGKNVLRVFVLKH